MLTPIWMLIEPETVLRLVGMGFRLHDGEQILVRPADRTVELGDSARRLMRHNGHKRQGRRMRQVRFE
jgi:hypothetical protein